jgi:hypothetical protein
METNREVCVYCQQEGRGVPEPTIQLPPPPQQPPAPYYTRRDPLAVASAVMGVVSVFFVLCSPLLLSVPALAAGIISLHRIKRDPGTSGAGEAWVGILFGGGVSLFWLGTLFWASAPFGGR